MLLSLSRMTFKPDLLQKSSDRCPRGTLLGLDVGKKTIGVALGSTDHGIATPLETIKRTKFTKDTQRLAELVAQHEVVGFIIGLPLNMDGSEGPRAQSIRDFALELARTQAGQGRFIAYWDERLSTVSVEDCVDEHVDKRKTKVNAKASGLIDKLAAQVILQGALDFLETRHRECTQ